MITIGFSTAKTPLSALIRAIEGTAYSHTYIKYIDPVTFNVCMFHATVDSLKFENFYTFSKKNKIIEEIDLNISGDNLTSAISYMQQNLGKKYGFSELIGIGLARVAKLWFNKKVKNRFVNGEKTQVCSELVGNVLRIMGYSIPPEELEQQGPKYIYSLLKASKWT